MVHGLQSSPKLPSDLPAPPKTILLLTTPEFASSISESVLSPLANDSTATVFSAAVDSLPGDNGVRTSGHSWLITDHSLPIKLPSSKKIKSLTFSLPTTSFTLPLANTVFQTGNTSQYLHLPSTARPIQIEAADGLSEKEVEEFAHAREDIKETWEELGELMKLVGQKAGLAQVIPVPEDSVEIRIPDDVLKDESGTGRIFTQLPLKALTKPRKITDGMGNILRNVETPEGPQGASRELEAAIAEYTPPEGAEKLHVFARLTAQEPSSSPTELLLAPGTRIHRLLSGGGGWGNKAGLLSLDPQSESDVSSFARMFEERFNAQDGDEQGVLGIVREGEWVQFFVSEPCTQAPEKGMRFGTVVKVDTIENDTTEKPEQHIDGCFGGASESGVDINVAGRGRRMDVPGGVVVVDV
ncbi:hypothetical protein EDC01DRAFT_88516 [Geopyxis carbonaria]|nr:hypothetical protein EDC01DRAFT_88516 [Geopyxis carbonaria]